VILNGATSILADHLTLALPAFSAARLLTGRDHLTLALPAFAAARLLTGRDHLTLALPAFAAARLLTGKADPCSLTYIAFFYRRQTFKRVTVRYLALVLRIGSVLMPICIRLSILMLSCRSGLGTCPTFNTR
jgi:hypothetical protein